jgi:metallophosphoesterase superfamily enzyme
MFYIITGDVETKFAVKTIEHESEVKKISKMLDMLENLSIINGYGDLIHDDIQILIEGKNNAKETYDNIR